MRVVCFTSISFGYLARARVLATTLKHHHSEWEFCVCITDREPPGFTFDLKREPFDEVIWGDELPVPDIEAWLFRHELVEACTAVKGTVLDLMLRDGADCVCYLDPDIAVLDSLESLVERLEEHSILLTPHQLAPDTADLAIVDNEIGSLRHGVYNLGFIAVRNDETGRRMAEWWRARLERYCYDDLPHGLFVDQRWCDLLPVFFDNVGIVRDPGYNVASWNISQRHLEIGRDGRIVVNGSPLRFYHFTKLGPLADVMTQRYARDNLAVYEVWAWYRRLVERFRAPEIPAGWWYYAAFDNGVPIPREARVLYRERRDLQEAFPDPFSTRGGGYLGWLLESGELETRGGVPSPSRGGETDGVSLRSGSTGISRM